MAPTYFFTAVGIFMCVKCMPQLRVVHAARIRNWNCSNEEQITSKPEWYIGITRKDGILWNFWYGK
jgi:hypothetical protein